MMGCDAKIITVASHRQGVGKTTASVNIAIALSKLLAERGLARNTIKGDVLVIDPAGDGAITYATDITQGYEGIPIPYGTSIGNTMVAYAPDPESISSIIDDMQYVIIDAPSNNHDDIISRCIAMADSVVIPIGAIPNDEDNPINLKRQLAESLAMVSSASEMKGGTQLEAIIQNAYLCGSDAWDGMDAFLQAHYPNSTFSISHNPRLIKSAKVKDISIAWRSLTATNEYLKIAKNILDQGSKAYVRSSQAPQISRKRCDDELLPVARVYQPNELIAVTFKTFKKSLAAMAVAASVLIGIAGYNPSENASENEFVGRPQITAQGFAFHDAPKEEYAPHRNIAIAKRRKRIIPGVYANRKRSFTIGDNSRETLRDLIFNEYADQVNIPNERSFDARRYDKHEKVRASFASTAMFAPGASQSGRGHHAYDFGAPGGLPVTPPAEGTITAARWMGSCGWAVEIEYGEGLRTRYCHLSKLSEEALNNVGRMISEDTIVGWVGDTGVDSYGNHITNGNDHLHVKCFDGGKPIRAYSFLKRLKNISEQ